MKLIDLDPMLLEGSGDTKHARVERVEDAEGLLFLCPTCQNHYVLVWFKNADPKATPKPARWVASGKSVDDLTLTGSILLGSGCRWHGFITNGDVRTV